VAREHRGLLSIGALAAATGIPVETLRTWERRYGYPVAERKPSGHRVYPLDTIARLRLIAQALQRGHRAAEVVAAPPRALEALVATLPLSPGTPGRQPTRLLTVGSADATDLLEAVRRFDHERLEQTFQAEWARMGPLEFLERRAAPFLTMVGEAWAEGTLDIHHEHFASAALGDFLRTTRAPLEERATGPIAALTTLPGELHGLGLEMAAVVFAVLGWRPLMLGVNTPLPQIASLTREAPIAAVALSAAAPHRRRTDLALQALRRRLARHIPILVGGAGAPRTPRTGIEVFPDLNSLDRWIRANTP
jgi:methanogenic corrinoid protein MtbC1